MRQLVTVCSLGGGREVNANAQLSLFYGFQDPSCGMVLCTFREGLSTASVKLHGWFTMVMSHHSIPCHSSVTLPEAGFMMSFLQSA